MQDTPNSLLAQMARPAKEPKPLVDASPDRALRIAIDRAAAEFDPLTNAGSQIAFTVVGADDLQFLVEQDFMVAALDRGGKTVGIVIVCDELRNAMIEVQTAGFVQPRKPSPRASTVLDLVLVSDLITASIGQIGKVDTHQALTDSLKSIALGSMVGNPRSISMLLADGDYDVLTATYDFGHDRKGRMMIALKPVPAKVEPPVNTKPTVNASLSAAVMDAPARLDAVLHKFTLPISVIEGFDVGQVLPLNGASLHHISLIGPDKKSVGIARLGQLSGQRAVRLDVRTPPEMTDGGVSIHKTEPSALAAGDRVQLGNKT